MALYVIYYSVFYSNFQRRQSVFHVLDKALSNNYCRVVCLSMFRASFLFHATILNRVICLRFWVSSNGRFCSKIFLVLPYLNPPFFRPDNPRFSLCSFRVFGKSQHLIKILSALLDHFDNIVINGRHRHLDCVAIVKADYPPVHKRAENDAQPRGKKHPTRHQSPYQKPFFQSRFPPHTLYIFNLLCSQKLHTAFTKIFHPQKCEKNGCVYNVYNI